MACSKDSAFLLSSELMSVAVFTLIENGAAASFFHTLSVGIRKETLLYSLLVIKLLSSTRFFTTDVADGFLIKAGRGLGLTSSNSSELQSLLLIAFFHLGDSTRLGLEIVSEPSSDFSTESSLELL